MNELVSVIIPVYNREKTIIRAMDSVLEQTYSNLELIVVDDCSNDKTVEKINSLKDSRIRLIINNENRGANYSRNRGVEQAKGEYVAFQDSDDVWKCDKLEKCITALKQEDVNLVFSGMMKYGKNYKRYLPLYNLNDYENKYHKLLMQNCMSTQTLVGKKECFEKCKFDNKLPKMQDWDELLRLIQYNSIYYIDEALVDAYIQSDSITMNDKGFQALSIIYGKHKEYIEKHEDIKISFYKALGVALENSGKRGTEYFKEVFLLDKSVKNFFVYVIAKLHLYGLIITNLKKIERTIMAKLR